MEEDQAPLDIPGGILRLVPPKPGKGVPTKRRGGHNPSLAQESSYREKFDCDRWGSRRGPHPWRQLSVPPEPPKGNLELLDFPQIVAGRVGAWASREERIELGQHLERGRHESPERNRRTRATVGHLPQTSAPHVPLPAVP